MMFITFEGGEGVGKSTQIALLATRLRAAGFEVTTLREPGSSTVSEAIRAILLDPAHAGLSARAELLLYEAARAQLTAECVRPALQAGGVVLCDRYCDSTTAYQGYGRGLALSEVQALNAVATGGLVPDVTIVLDLPVAEGLRRAQATAAPDRLEQEESAFHERVRAGFLALAAAEPQRIQVIDAGQTRGDVARAVMDVLTPLLDIPQKTTTGTA
ncbi:MAG: dTMP kinase [Actinomycetes bacterium]|jgi:dTMP kinase|nr:dTMP kinase [Actinomycetes bacterium]